MKKILKAFMSGAIFCLMSFCAFFLGAAAYFGITAIPNCSGWEAIGLALTVAVILFLALYVVYCIGAIPLSAIDDLKRKLEDKEDD